MNTKVVIYFMEGMVAAFRNAILAETHSHHALQITLDFDGEFQLFHQDECASYKCAMIPPNLSHRLDASGHWQLTVLLDPELTITQKLIHHFAIGDKPKPLPQSFIDSIINEIGESPDQLANLDEFKVKFLAALWQLVNDSPIDAYDVRIANLIEQIHETENLSDVEHLITQVPLSRSRLSHLFVEQTGIPLRSYLVWLRVRRSVQFMLEGYSITESAHMAGFSDLAHLSRSFKKIFGINVSLLFQTKDYIQLEIEKPLTIKAANRQRHEEQKKKPEAAV